VEQPQHVSLRRRFKVAQRAEAHLNYPTGFIVFEVHAIAMHAPIPKNPLIPTNFGNNDRTTSR
jgi:hypothetical protein